MPIRIIITDDHPLIVSGLRTILREVHEIEVTDTCYNGDELIDKLRAGAQPDVLLVDLQMPGTLQGAALIKALCHDFPHIPVLVLSGQETLFNVKDIMALGSKGYLLKNSTDPQMLVDAIRTVYYGDLFLEPSLKEGLLRSILKKRKEQEDAQDVFTRRQVEILRLLSEGYSSPQIAGQLHLSVRTIESHRQRLMQRLHTNNVTGLLKKAADLGLISR